MRPEDMRADKKRPFTGAEYLESMRTPREVAHLLGFIDVAAELGDERGRRQAV